MYRLLHRSGDDGVRIQCDFGNRGAAIMTDLIERSLLTALANMISARPESPQKVFVVYDSDIPKLVKDIRAGLAGETSIEPASQTFAELCADKSSIKDYLDKKHAWMSKREREGVAEDYPPGCA
jgi:hypothetical protein